MLINSNPQLKAQSRAVEKKTVKNCFSGNIVKVHGNLIFSSHTDTGLAVNKGAVFLLPLSLMLIMIFTFLIVGLAGILGIRL